MVKKLRRTLSERSDLMVADVLVSRVYLLSFYSDPIHPSRTIFLVFLLSMLVWKLLLAPLLGSLNGWTTTKGRFRWPGDISITFYSTFLSGSSLEDALSPIFFSISSSHHGIEKVKSSSSRKNCWYWKIPDQIYPWSGWDPQVSIKFVREQQHKSFNTKEHCIYIGLIGPLLLWETAKLTCYHRQFL